MAGKPPPDPVFILRGSSSPVSSLHISKSKLDILYTGNQQGQILVWDLKRKRVIQTLKAHDNSTVLWITTLGNDELISQGRDGQVKRWKLIGNDWCEQAGIKCSSQTFCAASIFTYNDNSYLIIPNDRQSVIDIINIHNTQVLSTLIPTHDRYGMCMCLKYINWISEQNTSKKSDSSEINMETKVKPLLLVGYENGSILLWDILSRTVLSKLDLYKDSIMCLDFSDKLLKGLSGSVNNELQTFTINSDLELVFSCTIPVTNEGFSSITIRPDSKLVVTTGWDSTIRLFSMKSWKPLAVLKYHKESVQCAAFTTDNILICGSKDCLISLWKIYS